MTWIKPQALLKTSANCYDSKSVYSRGPRAEALYAGADGEARVRRVVCALDCGLTAALWGEITFEKGRVQQSNFGDYRMMRMN